MDHRACGSCDCPTFMFISSDRPSRLCRLKVEAPPDTQRIATEVNSAGVTVRFPAGMAGRALVLVETPVGFTSGWIVSNNALAAIPRELLSQLAELRLQPAA